MRKIAGILALLGLFTFPTFAAPGKVEIVPNLVGIGDRLPQVCVSKFRPGSIVFVMLPTFTYGFAISERATYCHQPELLVEPPVGSLPVDVIVCKYVAGGVPSNCKVEQTLTLTVQ